MTGPMSGQTALFAIILIASMTAVPAAEKPAPTGPAPPAVESSATRPALSKPEPPVAETAVAPRDFPFEDMKGAAHTLKEFRGQVVVLEFWASWCVPCRKGFPFLDQLGRKHEGKGLKVIAVTLETDDEAVAEFVAAFPATFLVGRDRTGHGGELFEVAAMPTALLLDREGKLVARFEGGSETVHERLEKSVEEVLAGKTPTTAQATVGRKGPSGNLKAWERAYLADPIMNLDGDTLTRSMREHIHASKEGAAGDGGVAGGGCGCN